MFNFLNKNKPTGSKVTFKIIGMHCASCSLNIDGELEDLDGVVSSSTSYAKAKTVVCFDPQIVTAEKIKTTIEQLEYQVE